MHQTVHSASSRVPPHTAARRKAFARQAAEVAIGIVVSWVVTFFARQVIFEQAATVQGDAQQGIHYWELARTSIARGHGFPLWDRTQCFGYPFLSNPETPVVSALVAGVFRIHGDVMARIYPAIGVFLTISGLSVYARRSFGVSLLGSLLAGSILGASGFVAAHFAGHMSFVPFALMPWVLWLAREGEQDIRKAVASGLLLALMVLEGGTYAVPYTVIALIIVTLPRVFVAPPLVLLKVTLSVVIPFVLIASVKIVPSLMQLARHPRLFLTQDSQTLSELIPMFIGDRHGGFEGHEYVMDEYRAYIGPLALGAAIAGFGCAFILRPRRVEPMLLAAAGLLLARGDFGPYSPWHLLIKLPIFAQLRVPSRWSFLAIAGLAICAGIALDAAIHALKRTKWLKPAVWLFAGLAVFDPLHSAQANHEIWIGAPLLPRPDPPAGPFRLDPMADVNRYAEFPAKNVGGSLCYSPWDWPYATDIPLDGRPHAWTDSAGALMGRVMTGQNAARFEVESASTIAVHVNDSFDPDFRSDQGTLEASAGRSLLVRLPPGKHVVTIQYRPAGLVLGWVLTAAGLVLSTGVLVGASFVRWRKRRRQRQRDQSFW